MDTDTGILIVLYTETLFIVTAQPLLGAFKAVTA